MKPLRNVPLADLFTRMRPQDQENFDAAPQPYSLTEIVAMLESEGITDVRELTGTPIKVKLADTIRAKALFRGFFEFAEPCYLWTWQDPSRRGKVIVPNEDETRRIKAAYQGEHRADWWIRVYQHKIWPFDTIGDFLLENKRAQFIANNRQYDLKMRLNDEFYGKDANEAEMMFKMGLNY